MLWAGLDTGSSFFLRCPTCFIGGTGQTPNSDFSRLQSGRF